MEVPASRGEYHRCRSGGLSADLAHRQRADEIHDSEGALLSGTLTEGSIDPADWSVSGVVTVATMRDIPFPKEGMEEGTVPGFSISVLTGSQATGTIENNELKQLTIDLNFNVLQIGGPVAEGIVGGVWDLESGLFNGTGDLNVTFPISVGMEDQTEGKLESWLAFIVPGSTLNVVVTDNQLDEAQINAGAMLTHNDTEVATALLQGGYKLGSPEGFNGIANMTLSACSNGRRMSDSSTTFSWEPRGMPR